MTNFYFWIKSGEIILCVLEFLQKGYTIQVGHPLQAVAFLPEPGPPYTPQKHTGPLDTIRQAGNLSHRARKWCQNPTRPEVLLLRWFSLCRNQHPARPTPESHKVLQGDGFHHLPTHHRRRGRNNNT